MEIIRLTLCVEMLESCSLFAAEFSTLFHPFGTEYDIERRHPETVQTLVNLSGYVTYIDDIRETLRPEIELIETRWANFSFLKSKSAK